jgi:lipoprotein-anchoring transpeptidase ErfK/SrfK
MAVLDGSVRWGVAMVSRALLAFVAASLGACNTALSAPLSIADFGRLIASYARPSEEARDGKTRKPASRSKKLSREIVPYAGNEPPGSIVVRTKERKLLFVVADKKAISYPVGVGKAGKQWQGRAEIDGAYEKPAWSPTPEMKRDNPALPTLIAGGSPKNPMGARALTLSGGKYAIHGTNRPSSIGTDASYGCIRMFNEDVVDLYGRVTIGTKVVVTRGS